MLCPPMKELTFWELVWLCLCLAKAPWYLGNCNCRLLSQNWLALISGNRVRKNFGNGDSSHLASRTCLLCHISIEAAVLQIYFLIEFPRALSWGSCFYYTGMALLSVSIREHAC
jgi:hypothetical protein